VGSCSRGTVGVPRIESSYEGGLVRKLTLVLALSLLALSVAPLAGAARTATLQLQVIDDRSGDGPTDVNGNGILDRGDFFKFDQTVVVTGSSAPLASVPVGTVGLVTGTLLFKSPKGVFAQAFFSFPNGSFYGYGYFSPMIFETEGAVIALHEQGLSGVFSPSAGSIRVFTGEPTTYSLALFVP
jgi:hypothetical protein